MGAWTSLRRAFINARGETSDPGEASGAVEVGDHARDSRRWPEAVRAYRLALQLDPNALHIATQLGHALKETGDFAGAEEAYGKYIARHSSDPDIHLQFGHLFKRQERFDLAAAWYEKAVALGGEDRACRDAALELVQLRTVESDHRRRQVHVLTDGRRNAEAQDLLKELMSEGAEDLTGLLGNVCKELGRFAEAETWYRRYRVFAETASADIRFDAELQSGHFEKIMGNVAGALGHYIRAQRCYGNVEQPSCSLDNLADEIKWCVREISLMLAC
jgi:tetratricopeptide (TPR) repeat protein